MKCFIMAELMVVYETNTLRQVVNMYWEMNNVANVMVLGLVDLQNMQGCPKMF